MVFRRLEICCSLFQTSLQKTDVVVTKLDDVSRNRRIFGGIQLEEAVILNMVHIVNKALEDRVADFAMVDNTV